MSEYFTVKEVADLFRVSPSKVYEMIGCGAIGFFRIGGAYRISRRDLESYEKKNHYLPKRERPF